MPSAGDWAGEHLIDDAGGAPEIVAELVAADAKRIGVGMPLLTALDLQLPRPGLMQDLPQRPALSTAASRPAAPLKIVPDGVGCLWSSFP